MSLVDVATARQQFEADGFHFVPPLIDAAGVTDANRTIDRIVAGIYATGDRPLGSNAAPDNPDPNKLIKIDQPHLADPAVAELFRLAHIGPLAAALMDAQMIEVWAVQLLHKPSADAVTANVGWHQDDDYWHEWWEGEVFTCWLALSDVGPASGPVRFVRGSHTWGFLRSGNFFDGNLDDIRSGFDIPDGETWEEVPAVLPPGAASFHHRRTIHGSGPNTSGTFRRSYAIHLRTERSRFLPTAPEMWRDQWTNGRGTIVLHDERR